MEISNYIQVQESVCHWNLNSIPVHNFSKLTQLEAYISTYEHDFICLSETYLDSSTPNNLIDTEWHILVRADHPNNFKRAGVCFYHKESLLVRVVSLSFFKEALPLEMSYNKRKVFVSLICRSPSQSKNKFGLLLSNLEIF